MIRKKPQIIRDKLKHKIIRDISRLFETKKEERKKKKYNGRINKNIIITGIRTLFETKKAKEERKKKKEHNKRLIKDGIIIRLFEQVGKEKDYHERKRVNNFWNNSYIEYESNGDKNKNF